MKLTHYAIAGMGVFATARGQITQPPAAAPAPYTPPIAPHVAPGAAPSVAPAPSGALPAPSMAPSPSTAPPRTAPAPAPLFVNASVPAPAPLPFSANASAPAPAPAAVLPPLVNPAPAPAPTLSAPAPAPLATLAPAPAPTFSPAPPPGVDDPTYPCLPLPDFVQACIFTASDDDAVFTTIQNIGSNHTYAIRIANPAGQERGACQFALTDNQQLITDVCGAVGHQATYRAAVRNNGGI